MAGPVSIDIVSDVMCPWCLIGKRRLEKALELRPGVEVEMRWRPYQLDPTIPEGGMDRREYLERKFGGPERAKAIYEQIREAGEQEGIDFRFDLIERSPNTLDAHRLIRWAATPGVQNEVVDLLFRLYFTEGANVGDHEVLLGVARDTGMDVELVGNLLKTDADVELVQREIALAQQMGVTGVPCYVFAGKFGVLGAQSPEILADALDRAVSEAA
ncbi:MAG: DsbA family oxidoreductase [Flavobacteriaceae bacterium]